MAKSTDGFQDEYNELLNNVSGMSDADLERLMGGGEPEGGKSLRVDQIESGTRVHVHVVEVRHDEVLVELDGKNLGVIDIEEFHPTELPAVGAQIDAEFVRYDPSKEASILSTQGVREQGFWEELKVGTILSGTVVATNKGGLTIDIKGERAFLPISQIARERVEDLDAYVGRKLQCEVTQVNRTERDLVVSRRVILDREAEISRQQAIENLSQGDVVTGTVTRINDHGAFIDLGGVDGLLHARRIRQMQTETGKDPVREGQKITVEIVSLDVEQGRVGLDVHRVAEDSWEELIESYAEGDHVTGWVSRVADAGVVLTIDEGLEALIPSGEIQRLSTEPEVGSILRVVVTKIDPAQRQVQVRPA